MIEKESTTGRSTEILLKMHDELSSGLLYTHTRINDNTRQDQTEGLLMDVMGPYKGHHFK